MFSPCQKDNPRLSSLLIVAMEDLCLVWKQNVQILIFGCQIFRSDFKNAKWQLYGFREPWLALCGNKSDGCIFCLDNRKRTGITKASSTNCFFKP